MDLQENQEDLKEIKQKPRDKTLFFVKIFFVLFLFLAIAITVSSFSLFNLIMILFESLLIYPFCLLIANEKNYTKTTFFVLLIFFTISSFHMIYFCYNVNQYPGMLNPAFWLLLLLYLIASKIILINSLEKKEVSTFKLFKLRTYNTFKKNYYL
jgi:magnesium-transporting ATPase (P-type)